MDTAAATHFSSYDGNHCVNHYDGKHSDGNHCDGNHCDDHCDYDDFYCSPGSCRRTLLLARG